MLADGTAYRCYCSRERLDALRAGQIEAKVKARYDGRCRDLDAPPTGQDVSDQPVIRFRQPREGHTVVHDQVKGHVVFDNHELDGLIIAGGDGTPTYNFVVVVDDMDMKVSHVIRGDDHLNNSARQSNILQAPGAEPPVYPHVPMILDEEGKKLSKRTGAANVMEFRDAGYLPEAMINYLVRLGWAHGDQEIFSLDEMVELFDVADINHSASSINPSKLDWLNQHYIKTLPVAYVARHLAWHLGAIGLDPAAEGRFVTLPQGRLHAIVRGEGPDLIMIHGASSNARDFSFDLVDRMADEFCVIAFDRPGFGYSDSFGDALSPMQQAVCYAVQRFSLGWKTQSSLPTRMAVRLRWPGRCRRKTRLQA